MERVCPVSQEQGLSCEPPALLRRTLLEETRPRPDARSEHPSRQLFVLITITNEMLYFKDVNFRQILSPQRLMCVTIYDYMIVRQQIIT